MITIRQAQSTDYPFIYALTKAAFWDVYAPGCVEHVVVARLHEHSSCIKELEFVLLEDQIIIGHITYTMAQIKNDHGSIPALMFGPVSVLPTKQKQGYGSQLIRFSLIEAQARGYPFVLIIGEPATYQRFGFQAAERYGIRFPGLAEGADTSFFMIKVFDETRISDLTGVLEMPQPYLMTPEDVLVYEAQMANKPHS